ncbi:hypothetical protein TNCV_4939631 [Trichonephila clavipes]|nr:hypothetical protein TNCV_4939631 [Trichonephila clavipes]
MPSPVQSNCDAHDTIANGQYGAVWSMGHTQQEYRIVEILTSGISPWTPPLGIEITPEIIKSSAIGLFEVSEVLSVTL